MFQEVKQTHDEKMAMYMKSSKKELAEMVIECNRLLDIFIDAQPYNESLDVKTTDAEPE